MEKTRVLSVLVENHAGVLSRVAGLFTRRAYNIDSLSVGETENPDISRMTIVVHADDATLEQIQNQLAKLINVFDIVELHCDNAVLREHVLVSVGSQNRSSFMEITNIFRAKIIDISEDSLMAELTGSPSKISAFVNMIKPFGIKSLVRTGLTGLERGSRICNSD